MHIKKHTKEGSYDIDDYRTGQALSENMKLLTHDRMILQYGDVAVEV